MSIISNKERNKMRLAELLRKNPMATHALLLREDDTRVDVPLTQVDMALSLNPRWVIDEVATAGYRPSLPVPSALPPETRAAIAEKVFADPIEVPEKPSEQTPKRPRAK